MAITPINVARVSHNMQTLSLLSSLRANTLDLFLQQNRLASGKRLNAPSEDPVGASQALKLSQMLERQEQVLASIRHADAFLSATDAGVHEISDLLIEAHAIASEMVNTTADQGQRDSQGELIRAMIDQLVTIGNRSFQGMYLFGGQQTRQPPFVRELGGVQYLGDVNALRTTVDVGQRPKVNLDGSEVFGALAGQVTGYVDLDPALTLDTRLVDLNGAAGVGVRTGFLRIELDSPASSFVVDLRQADTIGNVIALINQAAENAGLTVGPGQDFHASLNADANGLALTSNGNITVTEVGEGKTARDLGLLGSGDPVLDGADLNPRVTPMTRIETLFDGAGAALGSILIENGGRSATVDLSGAVTVQDVINRINASEMQVRAKINDAGTGIDVINTLSGSRMSIGEAGGDTAERLGIRSLHAGTPLSGLNDGRGVDVVEGQDDLRILAKDGSAVDVNLDGATTIQDVLDAINAAAADAGVALTASLATTGNGIRIVDATGGTGVLRVERLNLSAAIDGLGLNKAADPAADELISDDRNTVRVNSIFTAMFDLFEGLLAGDERRITDAGERIRGFIDHANRMQGIVGSRSKAMHTRLFLTEDAVVATKVLLSEIQDLDYTEAVTKFQQAQTMLQANLMTGSRLLELSLLNYI